MKKLLVIFLILIVNLGFGQQVNAPESKSFIRSTNGQDASGFSLSGFNSTSTLLCAIGLPQAPTGTTFNLTTVTGLTAATGYTMTGNKTRLAFTGTMTNINNALATLKINTPSTTGNIQISVSATVNPTGYYYNPSNGHFYRPISTTATYNNAKTLSTNQTFKGQQGYLVTLTSSDEENFVILNVPQNNIWIALTDEAVEGQWRLDAGPETGTLIKTANGQLNGNIQGQYNNWCGGEPNNAGNEDYAVTKWGGGSCWNDLPGTWSNPYIVEFGTWTNPDDQTFTEFYSNSVIHSNGDVFRVQYNFNFNNIDRTKFLVRTLSLSNNQWTPFSQTYRPINGVGRVDMSSFTDTTKISDGGYKANSSPGQVEWCVIYDYDAINQRYRVGIDKREFTGTNVTSNSITKLKLFDLWDSDVTFKSDDGTWAEYWVYTPTQFNFTGSSFASNIRAGNGFWGISAEFTFSQNLSLKQQSIQFQEPIPDTVTAMLDRIVTVSDVYLAFKEFADGGGLFGGGSGTQFTSGIQFMNADINGDGIFDERDCFRLLQHLVGQKNLLDTITLSSFMKLLPVSTYNTITTSNWVVHPNNTRNRYDGLLLANTLSLNSFSFNVFWKGDVNMSHSPTQIISGNTLNSINSITSSVVKLNSNTNQIEASIITELKDGKVHAYINLNPKEQEVVGTQFRLNYDNTILKFESIEFKTKGNPTNYGTDKGNYVNLGSLISGGSSVLDNTTEYKITFSTIQTINNVLGLTSISNTDAINKSGVQLSIKIN